MVNMIPMKSEADLQSQDRPACSTERAIHSTVGAIRTLELACTERSGPPRPRSGMPQTLERTTWSLELRLAPRNEPSVPRGGCFRLWSESPDSLRFTEITY